MSYSTKNKVLIGLLLLLLLANIITICFFWLGKPAHPPLAKEPPAAFLINELGFDDKQKAMFLELVKQHQTQSALLRQQVKGAKNNFFKLLSDTALSDTQKIAAAKNISLVTEQLDIITFDHFKKVRAICNAAQQKKFDSIIQEVMQTIGGPGAGAGPGMHEPGRLHEPPPEEREVPPPPGRGDRPPPPQQ